MCVRSGARRSACVCCDVVADKALSMKMLSEVDGVHCLVVRPSSFLSIKTKDYSNLLGENLRGDRKGEEFIVLIGAGRRDRGCISICRLG